MRILCVLMVAGVVLSVGMAKASFSDDFNRADGTEIGNGWTETTTNGQFDPQIVSGAVSWVSVNSFPDWARAGIRRTLDEGADEIGVDLAWWTDTPLAYDNRMEFNAIDAQNTKIQVRVFHWDATGEYIGVCVSYKGMEYWTMSEGPPQSFHKYQIKINDNGQSRLYIDEIERWASADGGIGAITNVIIDVVREYWEWNWFNVDNFYAQKRPVHPAKNSPLIGNPMVYLSFDNTDLGTNGGTSGIDGTAMGNTAAVTGYYGSAAYLANTSTTTLNWWKPSGWYTKYPGTDYIDLHGASYTTVPTTAISWAAFVKYATFGEYSIWNALSKNAPGVGSNAGPEENAWSSFLALPEIHPAETGYANGYYRFLLRNAATIGEIKAVPAGKTPVDMIDQWVHFAGTWDGSVMKLYLNGEEIASLPTTTETLPANWGYGAYVGMNVDGARYLKGAIDEFYLYNRALTANEIRVLAKQISPGDANVDGSVDVGDLGILAANYGGAGKTWDQGDFNGDGLVDVGDLGILAANYGSSNFSADYARAFGTTAIAEDDNEEEISSSVCSGLGLPLIAGLALMGLMLVKLEE